VNAVRDAGLSLRDIDGIATVSAPGPVQVAHALGIVPRWIDGTGVGGTSFLLHVRHAAAAIQAGYARTVLVTHGESGRSRVGAAPFRVPLSSPGGQFEAPYGTFGPTTTFTITALRYMKDFGLTHEQLAYVAVAQRRWAAKNPRAAYRDPITVEDVLASRLISSPLHLLDCCMISDGGGALVLTSAERARDLRRPPVLIRGGAEAVRHGEIGTRDLLDVASFQSGPLAFQRAAVRPADIDMCMVYDSYTITVLTTLEGLGFCARGEGGGFCADGRIALGGALPVNTDGGGLSSNHPGMRGIFLVIEATRQLRGEAGPAQVRDARLACVHGTGGMLGQRHSGVTLILGRT
jgi:acetyl-CoA acetyltransferase